MTFTISIGWWIAPTLVTIVAFQAAPLALREERRTVDYETLVESFYYGLALIVSLVAWLIWSLFA